MSFKRGREEDSGNNSYTPYKFQRREPAPNFNPPRRYQRTGSVAETYRGTKTYSKGPAPEQRVATNAPDVAGLNLGVNFRIPTIGSDEDWAREVERMMNLSKTAVIQEAMDFLAAYNACHQNYLDCQRECKKLKLVLEEEGRAREKAEAIVKALT